MPFNFHSVEWTPLIDYKSDPIYKADCGEITCFFTIDSGSIVPYKVVEHKAWVLCGKIYLLKGKTLVECDTGHKLFESLESPICDVTEIN